MRRNSRISSVPQRHQRKTRAQTHAHRIVWYLCAICSHSMDSLRSMWPYPCERWPGEGGPHNARLIQSRRSNFIPNVIYLWRRYLYLFLLRYYYYCGHVVALMINLSSGGRLMVDGIRAWRTHMPYAIHRATATLPEPQPHQMAFTVIQIETASVCRRVFRAICLSCVIASFLSHMNSYGFGYNDAFSLFTSSSTRWWYSLREYGATPMNE